MGRNIPDPHVFSRRWVFLVLSAPSYQNCTFPGPSLQEQAWLPGVPSPGDWLGWGAQHPGIPEHHEAGQGPPQTPWEGCGGVSALDATLLRAQNTPNAVHPSSHTPATSRQATMNERPAQAVGARLRQLAGVGQAAGAPVQRGEEGGFGGRLYHLPPFWPFNSELSLNQTTLL